MYTLIIPVAGSGTRMQSKYPKSLSLINGRSLLSISTSELKKYATETILVLPIKNDEMILEEAIECGLPKISTVYQFVPRGTAIAVLEALKITQTKYAATVWGDHVGAEHFPSNLLLKEFQSDNFDIVLPVIRVQDPYVYFDLKQDEIYGFFEPRKGDPRVQTGLSDAGVFGFNVANVLPLLEKWIDQNSKEKDLNLLSFFSSDESKLLRIGIMRLNSEKNSLAIGINSRADISEYLERSQQEDS